MSITSDEQAEIERLRAELKFAADQKRDLEHQLTRNGCVPCDVPACNCGGWHQRYGYIERFHELLDELNSAGYIDNSTGNLPINGLRKLIAEVTALRDDAERYRCIRGWAVEALVNEKSFGSDFPDRRTHWKLPMFICSGPVGGHLTFDESVDIARGKA